MAKINAKRAAALVAALALALAGAGLAQAELAANGNIRIAFSGGIFPIRLPRHHLAPVSVQMGAKIKTTDKSTPSELQTINLEINKHGRLKTDHLATCPLGKLHSVSSKQAKRVCGSAMVGHGNVTTRIDLPGQGTFATNGPLLAFNGLYHGKPAVFGQVATGAPLPLTYVIIFRIRHAHGLFGNKFVARMPPIASHYGYISAINLSLRRIYHDAHRRQSYLSADCPAPKGFRQASFTFARVSFGFADGRTVSSKMVRECKVRGK